MFKIHLAITFKDVADQAIRQLNIPGIPVPVIECVDLSDVKFVVVHAEGVAAPIVAKTLEVVSATPVGYPGGTLIAGELPYGFKIVTKSEDLTLDSSTGYLVAKYTEANLSNNNKLDWGEISLFSYSPRVKTLGCSYTQTKVKIWKK